MGTLAPTTQILAKPVVIVHRDCNGSADLDKVKRVFLGTERSLCDGSTVKLVDVEEKNPLRSFFLEKIVEKSEGELRQYWSRLVFTGKAKVPQNVGDDAAVRDFVSKNKEAVGLIDSAHVDATVKVLVEL